MSLCTFLHEPPVHLLLNPSSPVEIPVLPWWATELSLHLRLDRTHLWPCRPTYVWQLDKLFEWKTNVFDGRREACNTQPQLEQRPDLVTSTQNRKWFGFSFFGGWGGGVVRCFHGLKQWHHVSLYLYYRRFCTSVHLLLTTPPHLHWELDNVQVFGVWEEYNWIHFIYKLLSSNWKKFCI